ncbi:MAG: NAD(P)/FAD-dependent oxidoreductase, partial [Acidimicrobiaceae bacterium]|nr:NAD(P)/FAD-dependent oxidoreductase [Acidimicrobiaceae bacterium]
IIEKSSSPGGTWNDNRYPGCEVDVGSYLYSYSFKQRYPWKRTHAKQPQLLEYIEEVIDEYRLRPHLRLGVAVESAAWDEARQRYNVQLSDGTAETCHVLISAVGFLNNPRYPDWPGLEDFEGPVFHTFRWEHDHDLRGKKVAIVGTGSTSTQIVPTIAPDVEKLYVFQREPGWIIPKGDRDFTEEELVGFNSFLARRKARLRLYVWLESANFARAIHRPGTKVNDKLEKICRDFIDTTLADRPDLRAAVTPNYPFPGKRPIFSSNFYPALKADNVVLVPKAVKEVTPKGVVDADGEEHQVNVLVLATGFQPANYLASLEVIGRDGRTIHEVWDGEPSAFLGITVPGFPNFFMLYGPNTNGGEIIFHLEHQSRVAVRAMKRMMQEKSTSVEVRREVFDRYNRWIQRKMAGTAWVVSNNYYKAPTGKIVTQWPYGPLFYGFLTNVLGGVSLRTHRGTRATPIGGARVDRGETVA